MSVEDLRRVLERAIEALRDFIDRALPPEPALRPIPGPVRRPIVRRSAR
jgi:hypothetical protein